MSTIIIVAIKTVSGWVLQTVGGVNPFAPDPSPTYPTKAAAYAAAAQIWPANSVWKGKKIPFGYRIEGD